MYVKGSELLKSKTITLQKDGKTTRNIKTPNSSTNERMNSKKAISYVHIYTHTR